MDTDLANLAVAVDRLRWYVDAYGNAGMSSPVLVQPDDSFKFPLSMTADQFFAMEREQISGRAAGSLASASVFGLDLRGAVDQAGLQQYQQALADYQRSQAIVAQKQALLDDVAWRQYRAAIVKAEQITDETARTAAEAEAAKVLAQSLSGPAADATLTPPTPPASPALPSAASVPNAAGGSLPTTAAPQALFAAGTPAVSGETRAAILMAAGDVATVGMLKNLLDPAKLNGFAGRQVMWGVSMLSVTPGWRTREGYSADLQGKISYEWTWARPEVRDAFLAQTSKAAVESHALLDLQRCIIDSLPIDHPDTVDADKAGTRFLGTAYAPYRLTDDLDTAPVVAAASPMGDAQALDLQASTRTVRQTALQMAFALAGAGYAAQAGAFLNFAKSKQLDVETRTSNVVVSAYSSTGGYFGFKFNPRLVADPGGGRQSQQLQVPTFPTLLVIGMSGNELRPRVFVDEDNYCFVVEPRLRFDTSTRWTRNGPQCKTRSNHDSPCLQKELTEQEIVGAVAAAANAKTIAEAAYKKKKWLRPYVNGLWTRADQLVAALAGNQQPLWLPLDLFVPPAAPKTPAAKPSIALSTPSDVLLEYANDGSIAKRTVNLTLAGSELEQIDLSKIASPGPAVTGKLDGKKILLTFDVDKPGTYVFVLTAKDGTTIATPPLVAQAPHLHVIERKKTGGKDTLTFTPGTPAELVKSEIEKNKPLPVDLKVKVESGVEAGKGK